MLLADTRWVPSTPSLDWSTLAFTFSTHRPLIWTIPPTVTLELIQLVSTLHVATSARHYPSSTATSPLGFLSTSRLVLTTAPPFSAGVMSSVGRK